MVEPVHPCVGAGLRAVDRTNVVRFAIVVPGDDLGEGNRRAVLDEQLPPRREEPVVAAVDPVLVVRVLAVVLSRPCRLVASTLRSGREVRTVKNQGETAARYVCEPCRLARYCESGSNEIS